jgi:hypothetical protein
MNDKPTIPPHSTVKRPYERPQLVKLGTLRDLTMDTAGGGKADGAVHRGGQPFKTGRGGLDGRGRTAA